MVNLFFSDSHHQWSEDSFFSYLEMMSTDIKERILRYRRWEDRKNVLCGKLLLKKALVDLGRHDQTIHKLRYSDYKRPFFKEEGVLDFNITHSHEFVACAISEKFRVGVDVEKIEDVLISDFENQFTAKELAIIYSSTSLHSAFFHFWTRKESVVKADGRGLNISLRDLDVCENVVVVNNIEWYLHSLPLKDGYSVHLACNGDTDDIRTIPCSFSVN